MHKPLLTNYAFRTDCYVLPRCANTRCHGQSLLHCDFGANEPLIGASKRREIERAFFKPIKAMNCRTSHFIHNLFAAVSYTGGMNIVLNKIRIDSPIESVFEIVTTARFWPEWHPSCTEVDGVVNRPYQQGDQIHQVAEIAEKTRRGTWLVVEHVPLQKVTLEMDGGRLQIRYTFIQSGGITRVIRRLTYPMPSEPGVYTSEEFEKVMHAESELGLQQLKSLIERNIK